MNKELTASLAWGGGTIALAIGASLARKLGFVEADTVTRVVFGCNGLMIAWFGNRLPKAFVASAQARRARRVAGWSMALSGLAYAGMWATVPIPMATWGGFGVIMAGVVVTLGYCFSLQDRPKTSDSG
jgi:hypothetical protein